MQDNLGWDETRGRERKNFFGPSTSPPDVLHVDFSGVMQGGVVLTYVVGAPFPELGVGKEGGKGQGGEIRGRSAVADKLKDTAGADTRYAGDLCWVAK